jgi:hypothetical protein
MARELPLPSEKESTDLFALFTMSVMLFPNDEDMRGRWAQAMVAESLFEEFESGTMPNQAPSLRIWKLLKRSREADAMRFAAVKAAARGVTAGGVLTVALMFAAHLPRFASVNNAVQIVMREQSRPRASVMSDWADYKSVSHLWAAQV